MAAKQQQQLLKVKEEVVSTEAEDANVQTNSAAKEVVGASNVSETAPLPSIEGASPGKIFVGGLPKETTTETFTDHFGKYGEITDSVIMKHRGTGHPRGFGFITYKDPTVVDAVIADDHVIHGKQVEIKRTIPKGAISGKDFKTKKIFVGGIPTTVSEDEFKIFFARFGEVEEHLIMRDRSSGRSRGFGFISFNTEKAVDDLLSKGNRIDFLGTQVEIKKAEPKKPGNAPPLPPQKHFTYPMPAFGRGFEDSYGPVGDGGTDVGSYRYGGAYGGRPRGYGGYGGSEFDGGYGGFGGPSIGSYQGEPSLGFSGRYGAGFGRGYDLGGYDGPSEGFERYGGGSRGAYGSGYDFDPRINYGGAGGYEGAGMYGARRNYGGGFGDRYHPYAR